jgi:hypothetical protein
VKWILDQICWPPIWSFCRNSPSLPRIDRPRIF